MNLFLIRLSRRAALLGGAVLLVIVAITTINAVAFLARLPALSGYEDFVRLTVGAAALLMLPYCQICGGHIRVELLSGKLSPAARARLDAVWRILTAAAAAGLGVLLFVGMLETRADNALSPILGWQEWPFYLPAIFALFLWSATAAANCQIKGDDNRNDE